MRTDLERNEMEDAQQCERAVDLIAWLYGEASAEEAQSFQLHLNSCSQCSADAESFAGVRQSVISWRDESLPSFAHSPERTFAAEPQKRSALAAIRQFLDLSPLWMKGAITFATLIFALLLAFSALRMRQPTMPSIQPGRTYSEEEVASLVEERARKRLQELQAAANPAPTIVKPIEKKPSVKRIPEFVRTNQVAKGKSSTRRPLTQEERDQLAADLRLIEPGDPELDLIEDRIARPE